MPVTREVLSEQVKDRILTWILEGELEPGSRIVETRVARELEVSQAPVREALRRLCAESNVVGFELVELAPMLDPTYVSALNANRLIKECMTGIAMRKQGLTDPHYLSPLTSDDGN